MKQNAGREAALAYENIQLKHLLRQAQAIIDMQRKLKDELGPSNQRESEPL